MVVTRVTTHFEISLLNFDAPLNAVSIIHMINMQEKKKKINKIYVSIEFANKMKKQMQKRIRSEFYLLSYKVTTFEISQFDKSAFNVPFW